MPIEAAAITTPVLDIASRRILRMALGTALSMWFSQVMAWPLSFIAPVFTMFILALPLPLPAPSFKGGISFVLALLLPVIAGMALLPFLANIRDVGIILVALALYHSFYYTAKGGSPLLGTFITVGLTLVASIGSVSIDIYVALVEGLAMGAIAGIGFVWVAHALLPDPPGDPEAAKKAPPVAKEPDLAEARRDALRSMLITFPVTLLIMFSDNSPAYTVVMIKVATMGQQASSDHSRKMGRSLLESTIWGGVGAIIGWQVMSLWPSLTFYVLLIGLSCLLYGARIFQGPAFAPKASMWTYALLTMLVILAPAVLDAGGGGGAGTAFYSRLFLFVVIAVYGTVSVAVFDAFWPKQTTDDRPRTSDT